MVDRPKAPSFSRVAAYLRSDGAYAKPGLLESSFLGHKPCGNLKASVVEPGLWRGRTVDAVTLY